MSVVSDEEGDSDKTATVVVSPTADDAASAEQLVQRFDRQCEVADENGTNPAANRATVHKLSSAAEAYCGSDNSAKQASGKEANVICILNALLSPSASGPLDTSMVEYYAKCLQEFARDRRCVVQNTAVTTDSCYPTPFADVGTLLKLTSNRDAFVEQDVCLFCFDSGHTHKECLKLTLSCYVCGSWGHPGYSCSMRACLICFKFGHFTSNCPIPRKKVDKRLCSRCNCRGHLEKDCPDEWRQYHSFIDSNDLYCKDSHAGTRTNNVSCFNCGSRGHLGHECPRAKMYDDRVWQFKPYVTAYNYYANDSAKTENVEASPPRNWRRNLHPGDTHRATRRPKPKRAYRKLNYDKA